MHQLEGPRKRPLKLGPLARTHCINCVNCRGRSAQARRGGDRARRRQTPPEFSPPRPTVAVAPSPRARRPRHRQGVRTTPSDKAPLIGRIPPRTARASVLHLLYGEVRRAVATQYVWLPCSIQEKSRSHERLKSKRLLKDQRIHPSFSRTVAMITTKATATAID